MRSRSPLGAAILFIIMFVLFAVGNTRALSEEPARQLLVAGVGAGAGALVYYLLVRWLTRGQ